MNWVSYDRVPPLVLFVFFFSWGGHSSTPQELDPVL